MLTLLLVSLCAGDGAGQLIYFSSVSQCVLCITSVLKSTTF